MHTPPTAREKSSTVLLSFYYNVRSATHLVRIVPNAMRIAKHNEKIVFLDSISINSYHSES